ncbi:MAG: alpha/beta fold hydrolase [Actinomycetota bacterium]
MTLAYEEAGSGRPVVLLHAFPLDHRMWAPQVEALKDRYRVITPDAVGFGGSMPGPATVDAQAHALCRLLDHLGIERFVLGGLSMGGYEAFAFLRVEPERVAGMVLADTRAGADTPEGRDGREASARLVEREGTEPVVEALIPRLLGPTTRAGRPDLVEQVRAWGNQAAPASVASALRGMALRPDSTPMLGRIHFPTLILVGEEDEITGPPEAEAMAAAIPKSQLVRVPESGHLANLENPEIFNSSLASFLDRLGWD